MEKIINHTACLHSVLDDDCCTGLFQFLLDGVVS